MSNGTRLIFVSPPAVPMGEDVKQSLDANGIAWRDETSLSGAVAESDVVYQTRIQRERFATPEGPTPPSHHVITPETLRHEGRRFCFIPCPRHRDIARR